MRTHQVPAGRRDRQTMNRNSPETPMASGDTDETAGRIFLRIGCISFYVRRHEDHCQLLRNSSHQALFLFWVAQRAPRTAAEGVDAPARNARSHARHMGRAWLLRRTAAEVPRSCAALSRTGCRACSSRLSRTLRPAPSPPARGSARRGRCRRASSPSHRRRAEPCRRSCDRRTGS